MFAVLRYYVDGRADRELICLLTTVTDWTRAPAGVLAAGYHETWPHEGGNAQIKTSLRGPGRILRSKPRRWSVRRSMGIYWLTTLWPR